MSENKSNLKICILGTAYPYKGGIASFNERLATELKSLGHQVEMVTFTLQYPSIFYPGQNQMSEDEPPQNLKISRMLNSVNPWTWIKARKYISSAGFDLIICKFWIPIVGMSLGSALRIGKNNKTRIIAIIDNIVPHEKRIGDSFFTKYFMGSIDACVCMSKSVGDQIEDLFPAMKSALIQHPIYDNYGQKIDRKIALNKLKLNEDKRYILFFGFIRKYKGLDWLLESFAKAINVLKDVELIVAGEFYEDKQKYLDIIAEFSLEKKVHLHTHFISNEDVKYYFSSCDVVAQTYRNATQSGISQIAINFEKPILSTDVGGLKETIDQGLNGIVCKPSIEDISNAMVEFFQNPNHYYDPDSAKTIKIRYSWESFAQNVIDLQKSLIIENDN